MKTKKLFLIIALVVSCAVGAHAQKTVFKFRDAQARAGDAVTEVCVKPTVVEVKILEDKGRIKDEWTLSKEEVEIAMKGELDNIRARNKIASTKPSPLFIPLISLLFCPDLTNKDSFLVAGNQHNTNKKGK